MATQVQSRGGGTAHPGALATAGGQSLKEITKVLQVAKFDALGALNGLVIAKRISEHCYGATRTYRLRAEKAPWKQLDSAPNFFISPPILLPSRSAENRPFASPWLGSSKLSSPLLERVGVAEKELSMALLKDCRFAQHGQTGGEKAVYHATAAITASEATSQYSRIPASLQAKRIWLPFKTSPRPAGGVNKIPHSRQGRLAKYTDPSTWMSYEEAVLQSQRRGYEGVGIVLHKELGLMGIDFDHCIVDGVLDPEVEGWVAKLNTYTEVGFSGEGLHSLAYGKLPWKANRSGKVEMYTDARFFVVTGRQMTGTPDQVLPAQAAIDAIHSQVFGNQPVETVDTTTPYYTEGGEGEL